MIAEVAPLARAAPIRVVIADDTDDVRSLLRVLLTLDGRFEVVGEARDGREAIVATTTLRPDAVVLDLAMPVMDGLQAIPEIRRIAPDVKVVVLSGFSARTMASEVAALGAHAYLEKGGSFKELPSLLLTLCDVVTQPTHAAEAPATERDRRRGERRVADRRATASSPSDPAELLAFVSHELQNPITVIQGFAAMLVTSLDRLDKDTAIEAAAAIERQAGHLAEMARTFGDARLVEVDALDLQRERVDLGGLVRQMAVDLSPVTDPHPVTISTYPVIASVDPVRVREVVANMVSNAAKFSPPETAIEIDVTDNGSDVWVEVRDRCAGIPEGREGELFAKFSRPLTGPKGTGLGLYISRGIARAHGGDLTYARRPGGGCRFILALPL